MEYLLVMTLSGGSMTCIYLLARFFLRDKLYAGMHYVLAKAAILYYLVPLPFLKRWYREVLRLVVREVHMEVEQIPLTWTNYAVHADGELYVNIYVRIQVTFVIVWLLGVCYLIGRQLVGYVRITRWFADCIEPAMTEQHRKFIEDLKAEYGVRRRISIFEGPPGEHTMTFGICRPVIVCGREVGSREAELLVRHEMVHIKYLDVLWRILMEFVGILHWCNPVMWLLYHDFERVSEWACDETVMRGKTDEEIKEYRLLMVRESLEKKSESFPVRWKSGFGNDAKKLKERMDNLMKKNRWNRFASGVLVAALIFANSMTVFAYRDVVHEEIVVDFSEDEIEKALDNDAVAFLPGEMVEAETQEEVLLKEMKILYDLQFTDEDGNVYPVLEAIPYRGCSHTFVSGTIQEHSKHSDGGCEVRVYDGERCSKCGYMKRGEWINTVTYAVCPH